MQSITEKIKEMFGESVEISVVKKTPLVLLPKRNEKELEEPCYQIQNLARYQ